MVVKSDLSSDDCARPGPEHCCVLPEPPLASALVHHEVPCVFWLLLQRVQGWCGPWCPWQGVVCGTLRRLVSRCRSLVVHSVTTLPGGYCSCMWAALGHAMGLESPTPRAATARGTRLTQLPLARVANYGLG